MLEKLLKILDIDTLMGFILTRYGSLFKAASSTVVAGLTTPNAFTTDHDLIFLKTLIPQSILDSIFAKGHIGQYALTFALRHQISRINLLLHYRDALRSEHIDTIARLKDFLTNHLSINPQKIHLPYLNHDSCHPPNPTPIIGFSATGIHLATRVGKGCRAFDSYTIKRCSKAASNLFCTEHQWENWWEGPIKEGASTQAKMFSFYANADNFFLYNENDLKGFTAKFWERYQKWHHTLQDIALPEALNALRLKNEEELYLLGKEGLRKRYLNLACETHPDMGGKCEDFHALKNSYEKLKLRFG